MLNIAVCDDEKYICDFLKKSVMDCLAKADLEGNVTVFDDGQPLVDLYREKKANFDIILLDITMKKCDGMTAAKMIRAIDSKVMIVFVTSSAEYVFSGYEVRAFRYILKPELLHGFTGVFKECLDELTKSNEVRFTFQKASETVSLPLRDIIYFESDKRIIIIKSQNEEYSFYGKLDEIEEQLKKQDFVRCHQSFLVNAKKISSVKQSVLTLNNGETIPISKRRAKETNEAFLWAMR
ncbi:MAG: response regulator transcription factor [Clostridia bacterium]|nr:response regulator transcription factor [Clostridia bacterium]